MPEQHLDHADIDILLKEVRGKGSPERLPWQAVEGLCRSVCGLTRLRIPAASAASQNARWSCRVEIGSV